MPWRDGIMQSVFLYGVPGGDSEEGHKGSIS